MPSRGPKTGRNCYVTPAFSGVPNAKHGEKNKSGYLTPAFSWNQKKAELLRNYCILGGPQSQARGENQNWVPHPCLLGGPHESGIATSPLPSQVSRTGRRLAVSNAKCGEKNKSAYLTHAFSRIQKRAELLRNQCILGGPQHQVRGENQKWLPHRCLLVGPSEGGIAT